jgi:hypothetical protein
MPMGAPRPVPTSQPTTVADQQDETDQFAFHRSRCIPPDSRPPTLPPRPATFQANNGNSDADQRLKQKPRPIPRKERRY